MPLFGARFSKRQGTQPMLLDIDANPKNDVYFIGSLVLETLEVNAPSGMSYMNITDSIRKSRKVSASLVLLALDWLYMLDCIDVLPNGRVVLCS